MSDDGMNNTTPEINWEKAKKPALILVGIILLAIIFLLSRCDGVKNVINKASGKKPATTEFNLIVPEGCEILTLANGGKQVVCPETDECLTEEKYRAVYAELLCNPPKCEEPTPTEAVNPPVIKETKKKSVSSCEELAKKTGQPWQCLNPKHFRNYKGNQIRDGLCPGKVNKCMIPGKKKESGPPPDRIPEETGGTDPVTFFCEGTDCNTLYLTDADNPNVRILTPGVRRDPKDPRKLILPPGTREVEVEYPSNIPVEIYNFEGADGNWSAQHQNARIEGNQERTTPEFTVGFKRKGKTHRATATDSVKNEDWGYRGEVPPPSNNGGQPTSDGGMSFDASQ